MGLAGHSLGGAVVIAAAARCPVVRTVVALSPQSMGAEAVGTLGPRCSLLIAHGTEDQVIPLRAATHVYEAATEPKELLLCEGAGHVLDEVAEELHRRVRAWILDALTTSASPEARPDLLYETIEDDPPV
jgi:dienelactone hydrolase